MEYVIKTGDTKNGLFATLKDFEDNPIDLTNSQEVRLIVKGYGETIIDRPVEMFDAAAGKVYFAFHPSEVEKSGNYKGEIKVRHEDGRLETFPYDSYIDIKIMG